MNPPHLFVPPVEGVVTPSRARRRALAATLLVDALVGLTVATVGVVVGAVEVVAAATLWFLAEAGLAARHRHAHDFDRPFQVARRHLTYLLVTCAVGLLLDRRDGAVAALVALGLLGVGPTVAAYAVHPSFARHRKRGELSRPTTLIVADRLFAKVALEDRKDDWSRVIGICLPERQPSVRSVNGVAVVGTLADVAARARRLRVHEVAVQLECVADADWLRNLEWSLEETGARLTLLTPLRDTRPQRVTARRVGGAVELAVAHGRPFGIVRHLKAALESVLAGCLLVVTLPVLLLCAAAVKLDSPGPAFFLQRRVRDGDRTFTMVKLRTMSVDAEARRAELESSNEVGGGLFKMSADPRVTRVGRVLRKLSLDELPQLVNVMLGQMALIGPRPALPSEVEKYDERARRRLAVKPGLTGLWQVSGRSGLSWEESVALDVDYVDNWHPRLDLSIAIRTIRAVLRRDGAY
jgi:exopolysaccharide biosynthesis polyprenyl glycosylphosphotransferase